MQFSDRLNNKPVISMAAMTLVEDGKLDLAAPVHQYRPRSRR
jgi:CubicO group peptidase (beta-lactamase class C family)